MIPDHTDIDNAHRYAKLATRLLEKAQEAAARGEHPLAESRVENAKSFLARATRALVEGPAVREMFANIDQHTAAYYTVNGVNLLVVLKIAWALPVAKEWRQRREQTTCRGTDLHVLAGRAVPIPALPPELPRLVVSRRATRKLGHANYYRHEIVIFHHAMELDVMETVLHEVAHILVGPRRREHHGPAFHATLKTLREEYLATERRPDMNTHP
jgi:hypothetical protein